METHIPLFRSGIGQASHRFLPSDSSKPCIVGGVIFDDIPGLDANSDGDVIFHALCNAISSLSGTPILNGVARELIRKDGITDSAVYVEKAVESLKHQKIVHVSITLEGKRPRFEEKLEWMQQKIGEILKVSSKQVGITVITGDGLTDFACGDGLQCFALITTMEYQ